MITMQSINSTIFAPVFFFFSIFLFCFTGFTLMATFQGASTSVVLSLITFVFAYNIWMFAAKLRKS